MGKNPWNLPDLPLLETQVRIVDLDKEILGMTAIGFPDTHCGFLLVSGSEIGNTEIVRKCWDMVISGIDTKNRRCLPPLYPWYQAFAPGSWWPRSAASQSAGRCRL